MSSVGTFGYFNQARLGIFAAQKGLSVAGNNIANINTPGYTRQRLEQKSFYASGADRYYSAYDARTGNGVLCTGVSQLRDPYLDIRYRSQVSNVGAMDAKLAGLEGIQAILDEVGKGDDDFGVISDKLHKVYEALQMLNDQTGHAVYDTQVRAAAQALADQFRAYAARLSEHYNNAVTGFKEDVTAVNNLLTNIRDLNAAIRKSEIHGDNALELRDERNLLIDKLSEYMKIDVIYTEEDIGGGDTVEKLVIKLGGANPDGGVETDSSTLVDGIYATQFSITQVPKPNPKHDPNDPHSFPFLRPDGTGTDDPAEAALIDSPNFDLSIAELRDVKGKLLYSTEKSDWKKCVPDPGPNFDGKPKTETDKDGVTTITMYQRAKDGTWLQQTYTKTPSKAVNLDDNDLYGALQSVRENLTEAGEFTSADTIANVDENAATKRGIPYYQKALDLLARQFAETFNSANQGYIRNEKGELLGKDGKVLLDANKNPITDEKDLTADQKKDLLVGFNMFSTRGDTDNAEGITASNISISKTWASGEQIVSSFVKPTGQETGTTDSSNILHMIALFSKKMDYLPNQVAPDGTNIPMFNGTFEEMWENVGFVLGSDMNKTSTMLDNYFAASVELDTSRDSVSSVDLNDEAMNLMQYQKSYNAACRLMTTMDAMIDKLINGTGLIS